MEDRLIIQVKRIYEDTKQAIGECNFLSQAELDEILLTAQEEQLIVQVAGGQISLIKAATLLRELHARFLRTFVLSAFDLTWDMLTTPKRFEYAKQKELELFESLTSIAANLRADEIKQMIKETINSISANELALKSAPRAPKSKHIRQQQQARARSRLNLFNANDGHRTKMDESHLNSTDRAQYEQESDTEHVFMCSSSSPSSRSSSSDGQDYCDSSFENITSKSEMLIYKRQIEESVLHKLNGAIASKLVSHVESLRNSYVGTLERCLASLEQNCVDINEPPHALLAFRQILNAAYGVEVNVQANTSMLKLFWDKMKRLFGSEFVTDDRWKRQQALEIVENLSEARLAKSICSQFRARLKQSHENFTIAIRHLEMQHAHRLQSTEELCLRMRKLHAPRMAKFALESTSLIDLILYGMPCLEKEIGRGQYGVVYACESWAGRSPCAVKSVVPPDDKHWYDLAMEFYYTRCIPEHERIVNIFGSVIDHSYGSGSTPAVLLVMERLNRDLYSAIRSGLDWLSRLQVAIDVVEGIRFLHNQGLVHRDIKLKNILLDGENRAKITDLGFCKPEAMMSGSVVGTPIHMSPELFSGRYDNSVDVYAFGILFWYICAGHVRLPHIFEQCQTRDQLWSCVRRGVRPERLPQFDNECWQLMVQCWDGDRAKRPHLGDVETRLRQIHARYE